MCGSDLLFSEYVHTHHGRNNSADVDRVVSFQIVLGSVHLVLWADLKQIQACLQNTRLILEEQKRAQIVSVKLFAWIKVKTMHAFCSIISLPNVFWWKKKKKNSPTWSKDHGLVTGFIWVPMNSSPESLRTYSSLSSSNGMKTASSERQDNFYSDNSLCLHPKLSFIDSTAAMCSEQWHTYVILIYKWSSVCGKDKEINWKITEWAWLLMQSIGRKVAAINIIVLLRPFRSSFILFITVKKKVLEISEKWKKKMTFTFSKIYTAGCWE